MKRCNPKWVLDLAVVSIFIALATVPALAQGAPKPSAIMDQYRAQRITWTTNIWPYANTLFGILATIEFAWSAAVMLLEKHDLQSWTSALVRKMMWIGAFYALLLNGRTWIPAIIDSFEKIGQTASGFNQIAPSDVFAQGIDIAGALMATSSTSAFFQNLGTSLAMVVTAAIVVLAFTGITIQFIVAMVESYIIVAAGFIFLGFGGSRWTAPYTERYIGLAVSIGLKIMLLYLLIGTGMNLSVDWMTDAQKVSMAINPAMSAFEIMGASLIFLMLCWQIPKLFSAVLGGAPALTGGDLLSTGTGIVAGAATIASLGAGAAAFAGRGAGAIAGVGAAANAGAGSSGAGAGTPGLGFGGSTGRSGGGSVPPPSNPGPSSNGGPTQPDPPKRGGGSGGASADLATVGSSSNGTSGSRNGSGGSYGSNGNHHGNGTLRSTGSGVTDHAAWLADAGNTDAARSVASNLSVGDPVMWSPDGSTGIPSGDGLAPSRATAPGIVAGFGRSGQVMVRTADGAAGGDSGVTSAPAGSVRPPTPQEQLAHGAEFSQLRGAGGQGALSEVQSTRSAGDGGFSQNSSSTGRGNIGSPGRTADQVLFDAARRLKQLGSRVQTLPPSDAAPHMTPPRMPIDHNE